MFAYITPGSSGQGMILRQRVTLRGALTLRFRTSLARRWRCSSGRMRAAHCKVNYGPNSTCNSGSVTTENAGYPQQFSYTAVNPYQHYFTIAGLSPSTDTWVQMSCTDSAGNVATNSCAAQSFQGGGINATTLASTGPVILTTTLPNGSLGNAYSTTLTGAGGFPPYIFTVTGTLPPGLTFSTAANHLWHSEWRNWWQLPRLILGMTDSHGTVATPVNTSITITALTITTASLPSGTQGSAYSQTLTATGGVGSLTWGHILGLLPPGLSLNSSTGVGKRHTHHLRCVSRHICTASRTPTIRRHRSR